MSQQKRADTQNITDVISEHRVDSHERGIGETGRPAHENGDIVGSKRNEEQAQMKDAVNQMGKDATLKINEGGRTQDSQATENPEGAVHGLPTPALHGTWR